MKTFKICYQVQYTCTITVDAPDGVIDRQGLTAAVSDIEIPEGGYEQSEYKEGSFVVIGTKEIVNGKE
jgi:hypothetical protein|tara:strand:- start:2540 stop:2743 length:204 start_codon:yes stop_codon:yes gene_type:complete